MVNNGRSKYVDPKPNRSLIRSTHNAYTAFFSRRMNHHNPHKKNGLRHNRHEYIEYKRFRESMSELSRVRALDHSTPELNIAHMPSNGQFK